MAERIIQTGTLTDIADAIRAKTGGTGSITPLDMPTEIASIPSGGSSDWTKVAEITVDTQSNSGALFYNTYIDSYFQAMTTGQMMVFTVDDNSGAYYAVSGVFMKFTDGQYRMMYRKNGSTISAVMVDSTYAYLAKVGAIIRIYISTGLIA